MNTLTKTSRRQFLKQSAAISGGLTLGFYLPAYGQASTAASAAATAPSSPEVNAWVVVRPDNTIIIRYARSEMGQGRDRKSVV